MCIHTHTSSTSQENPNTSHVLVQAAITNYHTVGGLNKYLFLVVKEARGLRSKSQQDWVRGEGLLPGLLRPILLCSYMGERSN
jgi:hypothetical protein